MARGVNKAIIVGTLGQDPDVKYTASGSPVVNISVATNENWKDKQTGEAQERTEWHRIVIFGKLAEIAAQYLRKGSQVYFEGKIQTRKWQDKDGQERYTTEVVANEMQMLDSRSGGSAPYEGGSGGPQQGAERGEASSPSRSGNAPREQGFADDGFDDDIPF